MGSPSGAKRTSSTGVPWSRPISMRRALEAAGSLISATTAGVPTARALSGWRAVVVMSGAVRFAVGGHALHHDLFGELLGDSQPGVANLADDIGGMADQADVLLLAQTHLPEAIADIGGGGDFLDADGAAGLDMAQRTGVRVGAMALDEHDFLLMVLRFHCAGRLILE